MKSLIFIIWALQAVDGTPDLASVRTAYELAATRKAGLQHLRQLLAAAPGDPVITCYRGAAEMMQAKYATNPINKLSAFGRGRKLIENGIAADSGNVECRFIRYGIQRNLPALLNYRGHLKADSALIMDRVDTLKDQDLKSRILKFIKRGR